MEQALADPDSIFHYYQQLIQLRKTTPVMVYGSYDLLLPDHEQIYAFTRTLENERLLVLLNFSTDAVEFELPETLARPNTSLLIANYPAPAQTDAHHFRLNAYEARVYRQTL